MAVQPGFCQTWSETPKIIFMALNFLRLSKEFLVCAFVAICFSFFYWISTGQLGFPPKENPSDRTQDYIANLIIFTLIKLCNLLNYHKYNMGSKSILQRDASFSFCFTSFLN